MIQFAMGIHNHQPVGNFDSVFSEATGKAYRPFLEALSRHPGIRVSIHNSGILYEWFEQHDRGFLDLLGGLVARGQVELLTGGFYEPILPVIPERDAIGQIRLLSSYLEERFGARPTGLWTAERVWEPHLPRVLSQAGVNYTLLDDHHFRAAGLSEKELGGYYLTEDQGHSVAVFPISKTLRYIMPFREVHETIAFLRNESEVNGKMLAVFGDDGEKFGIWPGTYNWVIERGWLETFFTEIEKNSSWIASVTLGEALDATQALGAVYLPSASYHEMMEWSLFDDARLSFHSLEEELKAKGIFDRLGEYAFFRGGFWRNFLAKYPEANSLHKKMMRVSAKVESASAKAGGAERKNTLEQARRELWAGQCNCPYWHGVFGGLYLPHLRAANYGALIHAENLAGDLLDGDAEPKIETHDYDGDGKAEVIMESRDLNVYLAPSLGAGAIELDYRPLCVNLMDIMRRKVEPYHLVHAAREGESAGEGVPSIHDLSRSQIVRPEDMPVDACRIRSFIDHFLAEDLPLHDFKMARYRECGDFADGAYRARTSATAGKLVATCEREGHIYEDGGGVPLVLRKVFTLRTDEPLLTVKTAPERQISQPLPLVYGMEFSIGEIAGDAEDRHMTISPPGTVKRLGEEGIFPEVTALRIVDGWRGFTLDISFSKPVTLWHFPVETISQSEGGVEMLYQGTAFLARVPLRGKGGLGGGLEMTMRFHGGTRV